MRKYFNLDKQVTHLAIDKAVIFKFSEIGIAERTLRDNNYRNLIFCSKIKFAELIDGYRVMYKSANFRDWKAYFEMDRKVSKHLMGNLIDFELTINSRVSHYISELMYDNELTDYEKNEIVLIISQMKNRTDIRFSEYIGEETWAYIPKMTFGEVKQLVFWLYDSKRSVYFKVIEGYSFLKKNVKGRFNELNNLRNSLFHLTPLTIYLTYGKFCNRKLNNNERKKVVKWILKLKMYQQIKENVQEICYNSDKYIKIKNSLHSVG